MITIIIIIIIMTLSRDNNKTIYKTELERYQNTKVDRRGSNEINRYENTKLASYIDKDIIK